jgi:hypothetical protein
MNVQMRVHKLKTFVTHLLIHMHQKEKIALEIAAKIASVNRPLEILCFVICVEDYHKNLQHISMT